MSQFTEILIITGYSGAGKSSVLRALEDYDFFCIDNLPLQLMSSFLSIASENKKVAIGMDIRGVKNMDNLAIRLEELKQNSNFRVKILFLSSSTNIILKRFQETRRKHPLQNNLDIHQAIEKEKKLFRKIEKLADIKLNTDELNIHQLRQLILETFSKSTEHKQLMVVTLTSFGFKYGVPSESNFVFDVRSLPNPYFIQDLKNFDGRDLRIKKYLFEQETVQQYFSKIKDFFNFALTRSYDEGRFFVNIAIGCTGGKHRSVAFAQELSNMQINNVKFFVKHRDILKSDEK
ncbi:RNase adapter RapZ [Candidatus Dependentiae bacterium]|nr:RNase adapter RapZ [Candidatus Dependentiae bacterium]